ncbi:polysaccharide ABC transporter ATP-binding protein [Hyphomonas sp.]|jgi:lipopolysaccharide transport system ATP-binding protein|uniref:polysaccharide ABC transporter ATP-binding protein n=1 Tax=Hyphomonas sp. TaxID=87 RepID=UPI0037BF1D3A
MSEDYLIRARSVTKTYRLHKRPAARLASLFAREKPDQQLAPGEVYHALRGIDLEIKRGEKVAIIGRNGAGKSTLLKIITGVIKPTTGTIGVRGKSHALLSLGAGFHPDFTGRENAQAFLAHMGVSGRRADELVEEAVAFAEIEEHIDQPLKTYSTGMQARLMFAVSTALDPELLVIDEVLGVGDAYFQHKSFERIREMCASGDTTLLIVSHDIYSAAKLVDRAVWIDKGRVMGDGPPAETIKAYENSIRIQEDARQKQKLALAFRRELKGRKAQLPAFLEIRARGNQPAKSPVYFAEASLALPGEAPRSLPIFTEENRAENKGDAYAAQLLPHLPWGAITSVDGAQVRAWNNFGAVDHKVGFAIFPLSEKTVERLGDSTLTLRLRANDVVDADIVYIRPDGGEKILHRLMTEAGKWQALSLPLFEGQDVKVTSQPIGETEERGRQGSGRIVLSNFRLLGADNCESFMLSHGAPAALKFDYFINDPQLREQSQIIVVFKRNGIDDVMRLKGDSINFSADNNRSGQVEMRLDEVRLGTGRYSVTVMVARERYFENQTGLFFSINPDVYDVHSGCLEFEVVDPGQSFSSGTGFVGSAHWQMT